MYNYVLTANGQLYHYDTDELYHYGVKGQKWGQRKASYASEKSAYKNARKDYRKARREFAKSTSGLRGFGIKGLSKANAAEKKVNTAELKMIDAKAKYKAAKSKNSAKAEFNTYRKEMQKTGLVGSGLDRSSGGRSTRLYNSIKATKGKAYADKVQKKVQNVAIRDIAVAATVTVGLNVAAGILATRD